MPGAFRLLSRFGPRARSVFIAALVASAFGVTTPVVTRADDNQMTLASNSEEHALRDTHCVYNIPWRGGVDGGKWNTADHSLDMLPHGTMRLCWGAWYGSRSAPAGDRWLAEVQALISTPGGPLMMDWYPADLEMSVTSDTSPTSLDQVGSTPSRTSSTECGIGIPIAIGPSFEGVVSIPIFQTTLQMCSSYGYQRTSATATSASWKTTTAGKLKLFDTVYYERVPHFAAPMFTVTFKVPYYSYTSINGSAMYSVTPAFQTYKYTIAGGATYTPVSPVRVLDSRNGIGLSGDFSNRVPRTLRVTGVPGIPSVSANGGRIVAVTGNLTAHRPTTDGYASIAPNPIDMTTGSPRTSTVNLSASEIVSNGVTVGVNSAGNIDLVWSGNSTAPSYADLIFDVTGYYADDYSGGGFERLVRPARILDPRSGIGLTGTFAHKQIRQLLVAGRGGVPADAFAVTGNVTVVHPTADGYVTVAPHPMTVGSSGASTTSTVNMPAGDIRANGVTVGLGPGGVLDIMYFAGNNVAGNSAIVLFDVTGYFLGGADTKYRAATYNPITPVRIFDSRNRSAGPLRSGVITELQVAGVGGIPNHSMATAIAANVTEANATDEGYVAVLPDPMCLEVSNPYPCTSTLNFPAAENRANNTVVGLGTTGAVDMDYEARTGVGSAHVIVDVSGYFR